MTITLSNRVLDSMGFRETAAAGSISAKFYSFTTYEIRGLISSDAFSIKSSSTISGTDFSISISNSINDAFQLLFPGDFVDSEETWKKEKNSQGPYAIIMIGPTELQPCSAGRIMRSHAGEIRGFDIFPDLRDASQRMEEIALPSAYSALSLALNETGASVSLQKIDHSVAGIAPDGTVVTNHRIIGSANLYTSRKYSTAEISEAINKATTKSLTLNKKSARFYWLGSEESDNLKQFLYYFLAIEVQTHATFGSIDHMSAISGIASGSPPPASSTLTLLKKQVSDMRNLYDRFVWCAACAWQNVSDSDVLLFKELKSSRDQIAHGSISEPPAGHAQSAKTLAQKILWS